MSTYITIALKGVAFFIIRKINQNFPDLVVSAPFKMTQDCIIKTMSIGTVGFRSYITTQVMLVVSGTTTLILKPLVARLISAYMPLVDRAVFGRIHRIKNAMAGKTGPRPPKKPTKHVDKSIAMVVEAIDHKYRSSVGTISTIFTIPFTLFVVLFAQQVNIQTMYGGQDLIVFLTFSCIMAFFQFLTDG